MQKSLDGDAAAIERRIGSAVGAASGTESAVRRSMEELRAEISTLLINGDKDKAKELLTMAMGLPEVLWAPPKLDDVMALLRVADSQNWQDERQDLFAHAVKLAQQPNEKQELAWMARLMGLSDASLPKELDASIGAKVMKQLLLGSRGEEEAKNLERVLKTLDISDDAEQVIWKGWHASLTVPDDRKADHILNRLQMYIQQREASGKYASLLGVLDDAPPGTIAAGFNALHDTAPEAHKGLLEAGGMLSSDAQQRILSRLKAGVPPSADAVSELLWLAKTLPQGEGIAHIAKALEARLPAERKALAQFLSAAFPSEELPPHHQDSYAANNKISPQQKQIEAVLADGVLPSPEVVLSRLKQPLQEGATPLSELRWLAGQVRTAPKTSDGTDEASQALLGLMEPHLSGNEKWLANLEMESSEYLSLVKRLADPQPMPQNPISALVEHLSGFLAINDSPRALYHAADSLGNQFELEGASPLQRDLLKGINSKHRDVIYEPELLFKLLKDAAEPTEDAQAFLMRSLDETVNRLATSTNQDYLYNYGHLILGVLKNRVSPAEGALIRGFSAVKGEERYHLGQIQARTLEPLFRALKTREYQDVPVPDALFSFLERLPGDDYQPTFRQSVLLELKDHIKASGDERLGKIASAAIPEPLGGTWKPKGERKWDDRVVQLALRNLEQQLRIN